ncbi:hypothetical protein BT63DRAFT_383644 [Microthyrium microscopicum]|uniref:Transcription factor hoxa13 n=1 Tax=Microthyrium microscopicum TaxID=703497 RepID=A0A6A6UMY8_9PEZI|nr:hypothetical protein BT63DRAFT_383644 [Microthyrium microscopicum]
MDADTAPAVHANGSALDKPAQNGHVVPSKKSLLRKKKKSSFISRLSSNSLRIILWSTILYVVFRCPSDSNDQSSLVCKQYSDLRSRLTPHIEPHYNSYVKPYVDKAEPHIQRFQQQVYTPTSDYVLKNYNTYAAPKVIQVQQYTSSEWEGTVQPKLLAGQKWAYTQYDQNLAPHVSKVTHLSAPYVTKIQDELSEVYDRTLIPWYQKAQPYAQRVYTDTHYVATELVLPHVQRASTTTTSVFYRKIWPTLVILYGENVEPQITRIIERLGRYKDSRKLQAAVEIDDLSASITSVVASASSAASSSSVSLSSPDSAVTSTPNDSTRAENEASVREQIESDLKRWQEKFAKAADKGAEDLKERVSEITARQINSQAHGVGKALVVQLDNTVNTSFRDLKTSINNSIAKLPTDAPEDEEKEVRTSLEDRIRSTGDQIRTKAVAVRSWKQNYDNETQQLIGSALDSTLDVIDNIRELGLQEIGLRWASLEGVTYKDWSKYRDLKQSFDEWRQGVEAVALKHDGIRAAQDEGNAVQEQAMELVGNAAKELKRLKGVVEWKIAAHDSSDDFSTRVVPPKAAKVVKEAYSTAKESLKSVVGQETSESGVLDSATSKAHDVVGSIKAAPSSVSSAFSDDSKSIQSKVDEAISVASSSSIPPKVWGGAAAAFVEAREVVLDDDIEYEWSDQIHSILDAAADKGSDLRNALSSAIFRPTPTQGAVESLRSVGNEQYARGLSAASSVLYGTPQAATASLSSVAADKLAAAVTAASYAIYGTPAPIHESIASQAVSGYSTAATQAQNALSSVSAAASSRLAESLSGVSEQYTKARLAVGLQPPPLHKQYLTAAELKYYEGIGRAHEQYSRFVDAASTAVYGTPTPYYQQKASEVSANILGTPSPAYQSMLSVATNQYSDAVSTAKAKLADIQASASSMMGMSSDSPGKKMLASASSEYDAAFTVASNGLASAASVAREKIYGTEPGVAKSLASAASEQVWGTEPAWNEALAAKASSNFNDLIAKASSQIYGTPTPVAQSVWSQANDYAAQATEAAASHYDAVRAIVSELVVGKEPDFTESVMARFSDAYYTGFGAAAASASSIASEGAASASSFAGEAYGSASSVASVAYDSASSVAAAIFTPPAALEGIFDTANSQFQAVADAASIKIYGTEPSYLEAAQSSVSAAASSAQNAASVAIFGTPTGVAEAAASSVASVASAASVAAWGPEQSSWESVSSRIAVAAASASASLVSAVDAARETVQSAVGGAKDEL